MEIKKTKRLAFSFLLGLLFFYTSLTGQEQAAISQQEEVAYKKLDIRYNWTIQESEALSKDSLSKIQEPYFLVKKEDGYLVSIEYKNPRWPISTYMFDATYQISFSKILLEYVPGGKPSKRLVKITLVDPMGIPTGQVRYDWDNKRIFGRDGNIRNCTIYKYSSTVPIGFASKEKRSFIFGNNGGALGDEVSRVSRYNMETQQLMEISDYENGKLIKRERFNTYNRLFTTQYFSYSAGKIKDEKILSAQGIKLKSVE